MKINLSESELRKIVREELATVGAHSGEHASGVQARASHYQDAPGVLDLSPLVDEVMGLGERVAELIKNSENLVSDSEWERFQIPNRIANKVMKIIRGEASTIARELTMQDDDY